MNNSSLVEHSAVSTDALRGTHEEQEEVRQLQAPFFLLCSPPFLTQASRAPLSDKAFKVCSKRHNTQPKDKRLFHLMEVNEGNASVNCASVNQSRNSSCLHKLTA